jgi:large subunit ribosomal protein L10
VALTKQKKIQVVEEISKILEESKIIVLSSYGGTTVKDLQQLRRQAKDNQTAVKVIKNRLFKKALGNNSKFKDLDSSVVEGQLIYAFSEADELAPAQSLAAFAKTQPQIKFVAAYTADGQLLLADDIQQLADLPTRQQLLGQLTALTASPLSGMASVLSGNLRGLVNVLKAKAETS